jgi:hypothetical protein
MPEEIALVLLISCLLCACFGHMVGSQRKAGIDGAVFGLLLGPFGVIAAGFLDKRPMCPRCGGRVDWTAKSPFSVCPHCQIEYRRSTGYPVTQDVLSARLRHAAQTEKVGETSSPARREEPESGSRPIPDEFDDLRALCEPLDDTPSLFTKGR